MANNDAPMGLRAVKNEYNAAPKLTTYTVKAATTIYEGAPVCIDTTGVILNYTDALALSGNIIGVANHYVATGATDRSLQVYDDPKQKFVIQSDDATLTNATLWRFEYFDFINPTTGNATTLQSKAELDGSSGTPGVGTGTGTLRPIRIVDQSKQINNELNVSWTRYIVEFAPPVHVHGTPNIGTDALTTNATFGSAV